MPPSGRSIVPMGGPRVVAGMPGGPMTGSQGGPMNLSENLYNGPKLMAGDRRITSLEHEHGSRVQQDERQPYDDFAEEPGRKSPALNHGRWQSIRWRIIQSKPRQPSRLR